MRHRAQITTPRMPAPSDDDATFSRTRAALHDATEDLELSWETLEDTVKIPRLTEY